MNHLFTLAFVFCAVLLYGQFKVENYYNDSFNGDWGKAFSECFRAMDSAGHGSLELDGTKDYRFRTSAELPRYSTKGRRIFIINGNGAVLSTIIDSVCIFNRIPNSQSEAIGKMMQTRFHINDLTFMGGSKGINIGATYQTAINRCNFQSQKIAAIDIQFGLSTAIVHCNSTNAFYDNFVLRTGRDWGGGDNNSQSNHSVIDRCRVYARDGANTCFKVLGSGGVVIRDAISEGAKNIAYSVYVDRMASTTVRLFKLENFHLEHKPTKAAIYIESSGVSTIDGVFYQSAYEGFRLIQTGDKTNHVYLKNVPHYVSGTVIQQDWSSTAWRLENCSNSFFKPSSWLVRNGMKLSNRLPIHFSGTGYGPSVGKRY